MSVANLPENLRRALASGDRDLLKPGVGETVDLRGKDFMVARGFGAGTYKFPTMDAVDIGTQVLLVADAPQTWQNAAGTDRATLTSGDTRLATCVSTSDWKVGGVAGGVEILDAGAYTTATNVEDALQRAMQAAFAIRVPLTSFVDADGDPLAKFVDNASPNPGFTLLSSEGFGIRWNNNATQNQPILTSAVMPIRSLTDVGGIITLNIVASKTGSTVGDATTFTVTAFQNSVSLAATASNDFGGTTSAMIAATTVVQRCSLDLQLPATGQNPAVLTFTLSPTSGTLGTDDVIVHGVYITFTR